MSVWKSSKDVFNLFSWGVGVSGRTFEEIKGLGRSSFWDDLGTVGRMASASQLIIGMLGAKLVCGGGTLSQEIKGATVSRARVEVSEAVLFLRGEVGFNIVGIISVVLTSARRSESFSMCLLELRAW